MNQIPVLSCREVSEMENIAALTVLIRSAYAPHAASGLRYWATHQSAEDTAKRLASGHGFVAELNGVVVATVTLRQPEPESKVPLLREAATWSFGQFAVAPEHKGRGFGKQIHDFALLYAAKHGCKKMALHTAQPATALIAMYRSWGYELAGTCDWRPHTNFVRVLMSKPAPAPHPNAPYPSHRAVAPGAASRPFSRRSCQTLEQRPLSGALTSGRNFRYGSLADLRSPKLKFRNRPA